MTIPIRTLRAVGLALGAGAVWYGCGGEAFDPRPNPAESVAAVIVTTPKDTLVSLGETLQLQATARDRAGNVLSDVPFDWQSSDTRIATVDERGRVTAVANGAFSISASVHQSGGTVTANAALTVQQLTHRVEVTAMGTGELTAAGQERKYFADAFDALDNPVQPFPLFIWLSSDHNVAVLKESGVDVTGPSPRAFAIFKATGNGVTMITAAAHGVPSQGTMLSVNRNVSGVRIVPADQAVTLQFLGASRTLRAEALDANNAVVAGVPITFERTDGDAIAVDPSGTVTAIKAGVAKVVAKVQTTAGGTATSGEATVTVDQAVDGAQSSVSITAPTPLPADGMAKATITVSAKDARGNPIPGASVSIGVTAVAPAPADNRTFTGTTNAGGTFTLDLTAMSWGEKAIGTTVGGVSLNNVSATFGASAIAFSQQPLNTVSNSVFGAVTIRYRDAAGNTVQSASGMISIALVAPSAVVNACAAIVPPPAPDACPKFRQRSSLGPTLSAPAATATTMGSVSFAAMGIDRPATGYKLKATVDAGDLAGATATSNAFDVAGVEVLAAVGTGVVPAGNSAHAQITPPAGYSFYGAPIANAEVSTDGITALIATPLTWSSRPIVAMDAVLLAPQAPPDNSIAPFWTTMSNASGGNVHSNEVANRWILSWRNVTFVGAGANPLGTSSASFDLRISKTGAIEFVYGVIANNDSPNPDRATGDDASIGLRNADGSKSVNYGFDTAGLVTQGLRLYFEFDATTGNYVETLED